MMKLLGMLMIFLGCTAVGYVMEYKYRARLKELTALIDSFEQLKGDIDYRLTPLPEACMHVAGMGKCGVGHIFRNFGIALDKRQETNTDAMWREAVDKEKYRYHLEKEDYELLYAFGHLPSYMDKEMQKNQIESVLKKLRSVQNKGEQEKEKTGKLYTGMGVLVGACLCILLI